MYNTFCILLLLMARIQINPFPVTGYTGPDYFCNREDELKSLQEALKAGRNVTIISLRRIGKTALIHHLFHLLGEQKNWVCVYVDLMPTASLNELVAGLTSSLVRMYPDTTSFGKKIWSWIKSIKPQITFDPYSGHPQIGFDFQRTSEQQTTLHQLFTLLEESGKKTVIALDEFQQITNYPEQQTEAWLRSEIQHLKSVNFIFSGSQQQLMHEMFNSAKRPFYASTQTLSLSWLEKGVYHKFIARHLKGISKTINAEDVDFILDWCRLHTYYVQALCNRLATIPDKDLTRDIISAQIEKILREQEAVFFTFRELLTTPQWSLLTAVAREGQVFSPTAKDFIRKYDLGTPATVKRSLESLLTKEMIFKGFDAEGESYYQVYDIFLSRWLEYKR